MIAIDRLSIKWKFYISNKIKQDFQSFTCVSTILWIPHMDIDIIHGEKYRWVLYKKKLRALLNNGYKKHPTIQALYGHLQPISKTIHIRRTSHAGQFRRNKNELINDVFLLNTIPGRVSFGQPARTYIGSGLIDHYVYPFVLIALNNFWRFIFNQSTIDQSTAKCS